MRHLTQRQLRPLLHAMDRRERDLRAMIGEERERTTSEGYSQLEGMVGDDADKAFVETRVDLESVMIDRQLKELGDIGLPGLEWPRAPSASASIAAGPSSMTGFGRTPPRFAARSA